jgi:hypothetical protein
MSGLQLLGRHDEFSASNFGFNAQLLLHKGVGKSPVAKIHQPSDRGLVAQTACSLVEAQFVALLNAWVSQMRQKGDC